MAKVKKQYIHIRSNSNNRKDDWHIEIDMCVNAKGTFYAYLKDEHLKKLDDAKVNLTSWTDKKGKRGYFYGSTMDKVVDAIQIACKDAVCRTIDHKEMVIKYAIDTSCIYGVNKEGKTYPNGYGFEDQKDYEWRKGSLNPESLTNREQMLPYGIFVYAEVFWKMNYVYASGRTLIEYESVSCNEVSMQESPNLHFLTSVLHIAYPAKSKNSGEIPYTEENAGFFRKLLENIFNLNEIILPFMGSKEKLLELIQGNHLFPKETPKYLVYEFP